MNAQQLRGFGLIACGALKHPLDEFLFELLNSLAEENPAVDHLGYETFQLILHNGTLRAEVSPLGSAG